MKTATNSRMMILLLEHGVPPKHDLSGWLGDNGFVAWKANDVCHAIEELSDFTVRRRPDVVMLEVASLLNRFDALTSAFQGSVGSRDVSVCAYSGQKPPTAVRQYFASDLDQLKSLISREVRSPAESV